VKVSGQLRKVGFFVMVLPYSDVFFLMAFKKRRFFNLKNGLA
jgi:hypothetical protein